MVVYSVNSIHFLGLIHTLVFPRHSESLLTVLRTNLRNRVFLSVPVLFFCWNSMPLPMWMFGSTRKNLLKLVIYRAPFGKLQDCFLPSGQRALCFQANSALAPRGNRKSLANKSYFLSFEAQVGIVRSGKFSSRLLFLPVTSTAWHSSSLLLALFLHERKKMAS